MSERIEIEHDDQPDWVAEKFVEAISKLGIKVEDQSEEDGESLVYVLDSPAPDLLAVCKAAVADAKKASVPSARLYPYERMKAAIAKAT